MSWDFEVPLVSLQDPVHLPQAPAGPLLVGAKGLRTLTPGWTLSLEVHCLETKPSIWYHVPTTVRWCLLGEHLWADRLQS